MAVRMWRDACGVAAVLLVVYLLTLAGHLTSPDEEAMYYVTAGLATGAGVAVPTGEDVVPMPLREGIAGQFFSPYGVLPSLLGVPLYWLGEWLSVGQPASIHAYVTRFVLSALNAPVTALTGAAVLLLVRQRGGSRRAGWAAGFAFGLATFAWPYARTFFSEPLTGLLLALAVLLVEGMWRPAAGQRRVWWALGAGVCAGLLLPTRLAAAVAIPALVGYVLWRGWHDTTRTPMRRLVPLIWFGVGLLPGVALVVWYAMARFGTPFASGYGSEADAFTTPMLTGLYGLLFSPGKSLLLYAPPVLLLAWPLARRSRAETVLVAVLALGHLLLYARWHAWEGGGVWGPRLLLPIVPLLVAQAFAAPWPRWRRVVAVPLLALGAVNALAAVVVNPGIYVNSDVSLERRLYAPADSPLLAHWRIAAERWAAHTGAHCALTDGFYAPQIPGALTPRYTAPAAVIACRTAAPLALTLRINPARPAGAPATQAQVTLGATSIDLPEGQARVVHLAVPPGGVVRVQATPWLAPAYESGPPVPLGVRLEGAYATAGSPPTPLHDAAIAPFPASPRYQWGWYFVPTNRHLVDLWPWYWARVRDASAAVP